MPKTENINKKVKKIFLEKGFIDETSFSEELKIQDDLNLDSFEIVQLVMDLNHEFDLEIKSEDITVENFETIGKINNFISKNIK